MRTPLQNAGRMGAGLLKVGSLDCDLEIQTVASRARPGLALLQCLTALVGHRRVVG
jgi:hypothetical protein